MELLRIKSLESIFDISFLLEKNLFLFKSHELRFCTDIFILFNEHHRIFTMYLIYLDLKKKKF